MILKDLRESVLRANLELVRSGLVLFTFGNASGIDRGEGLVAIKPSGVVYEELAAADMVVTDLDGNAVEGAMRPSSDLATHLVLYKAFHRIGGIAHTHSEYATAWAQSRQSIPCLGTTHADYFHGDVPVTTPMDSTEIVVEYERNTGHAIVRAFDKTDYQTVPGVLVANHGPFTWGPDAESAAHNAAALEIVARIAYRTRMLKIDAPTIARELHDKHFSRKHGAAAYYGQPGAMK